MSNEPQEPKHYTLKEKAAEGWEEFKDRAGKWVKEIVSDKRRLVVVLLVALIGIFAFIRGLFKIWFF